MHSIHTPSQPHPKLHTDTYTYILSITVLYPILYYAYYHRYSTWIKSEEWTFVYCVTLFAGHALSFLATRWSSAFRTQVECRRAGSLEEAGLVRVVPRKDKGRGEIVPLERKRVSGVEVVRGMLS